MDRLEHQEFARFEDRTMSRLSESQAVILVLLLSLGLWAVIWGIFFALTHIWQVAALGFGNGKSFF